MNSPIIRMANIVDRDIVERISEDVMRLRWLPEECFKLGGLLVFTLCFIVFLL